MSSLSVNQTLRVYFWGLVCFFVQFAHRSQVDIQAFEQSQAAAAHLQGRVVACSEGFLEVVERDPGVHRIAAGEQVDRCVTVLRPGVDGQVAFLDNHYARYSVGREVVECRIDDRSAGFFGRSYHGRFDTGHVVHHVGFATEEFYQDMPS